MVKKKQIVPDWLKEMPKTDLHCHMGGSIRPKTVLELAKQHGVHLPADDLRGLKEHIVFKNRPDRSLPAYLEAIDICEKVLVDQDAFRRVAYEICEDANNEGVNLLELRFGPTNYVHDDLKLYEVVESTIEGLKNAEKDFDMKAGLIICGIRTDMDATRRAAEIATNYLGHGVVGFDLAGKENGYRPKKFEQIINPVLMSCLPVTIHAGEDDTEESIREALVYLNARRIGHGVSLRQNRQLLDLMDTTRTTLETCVTSNIDTGSVDCVDTHPVRVYHRNHNLRVTVNTDNRTISDTNVTNEYMTLINGLGFDQGDVFKLARNGIKSAFVDSKTRDSLLDNFNSYARAYEE